MLAKSIDQSGISLRIVEYLPGDRDRRDASQRYEESYRATRLVDFQGQALAQFRALPRGGSHQGDTRVVLVEEAALESRGHRLTRAEIHHVERAQRDNLWDSEFASRLETIGTAERTPPTRSSASSVEVM